MVSIGTRFVTEMTTVVFQTPKFAVGGALLGYIYGKLANLPAVQCAKAWAILDVASNAILNFADAMIEAQSHRGRIAKAFVLSTIRVTSTAIGIHELRKRGLLGDKMMFAMIAIQALANLILICLILWDANCEVDVNDHQFNGYGKRTSSDGVYRGGFKNGQPHGKGKKIFSNGNVFQGNFEEGQPHGRGTFTYSTGGQISGIFERGQLKTPEKNG